MAKNQMIWFDADIFEDALASAVGEMEELVKQAVYSTMSKVRRKARTLLSTEIRKKWNIKKRDLDKKIRIRVGSRGGRHYESFEITIRGMSLSLSYFGAKQYARNRVITRTKTRENKRRSKFQGVRVEVVKGRKTKLSGAFMQQASSGHMMVMRRKGKSRYPVQIKAAISPASMFAEAATADAFEEGLMDYLERTFEHELSWRMQQAGLA
jgi:Arc/MetJ-type ribon-helix-helix transcriptional regulator